MIWFCTAYCMEGIQQLKISLEKLRKQCTSTIIWRACRKWVNDQPLAAEIWNWKVKAVASAGGKEGGRWLPLPTDRQTGSAGLDIPLFAPGHRRVIMRFYFFCKCHFVYTRGLRYILGDIFQHIVLTFWQVEVFMSPSLAVS